MTYMGGDEEAQWAGLRKEAMGVHRLGDGIDLAALAMGDPRLQRVGILPLRP